MAKKLLTFNEWFDAHNLQHIKWANEYFTDHKFDWSKVVPDNVVLSNDYGIREHIRTQFCVAWILSQLGSTNTKTLPTIH